MKWLRKIFGAKDRKETQEQDAEKEVKIKTEDLDNWLDERASGLMAEFNGKIASLYTRIDACLKDVEERAVKLSKVDLTERKVDGRVKRIVEDNRNAYVMRVNSFVKNIDVPKNLSYKGAAEFHSLFVSSLSQLGKGSLRNLALTKVLIGEESVAVNDSLRSLAGLANELKSIGSDERMQRFHIVKKAIKELKDIQDTKDKLGLEENWLLSKEKEFESEVQALTEEISKLKEGKEYKKLRELIDEGGRINQQISNIDLQIMGFFSPLQKALQKFLQMKKDSPEGGRKVLVEYVEDAVNGLLKDEELKIINLLGDVKGALIEGRVDLKDKKKEQTLKAIREVDADALKGLVSKRKVLEVAMAEIDARILMISEIGVAREIENAGKRLSDTKSSKERVMKEVEKVKGRQERISFEELEKKIVSEIALVTGTKISIIE